MLQNRRGFLASLAGGAGAAQLPLRPKNDFRCIFLMLTGGPSHLDTWDLKPDAPSEVRGPFRPIPTNVPGIQISEIFPRMARHADKYALIRSCYHTGEPIHEVGHQLVQTGRLIDSGPEHSIGSVVAPESNFLLPGPIANMGHGGSGGLSSGARILEPRDRELKYGLNQFGQSCFEAMRLVERGARFVTVNMFQTIFGEPGWDCHGSRPFSPLSAYRDVVGPMFDRAYSSLIADLNDRELLSRTLVVATGEFGRTPRINPAGGRDHWPECWTALMAGGGVQGGQVIGSSDRTGAAPRDRPVRAEDLVATIYHVLGVEPPFAVGQPVLELFV